MPSLQRALHDGYSWLNQLVGRDLIKRTEVPVDHQWETTRLLTGENARLDNSLESQFYHSADTLSQYRCPAVDLHHLKNVWLASDSGQIFFDDGSMFDVCQTNPKQYARKIRRPIRWGARKVNDTLFHLTGRNHENRGHFVLQHIPRLLAGMECNPRFGKMKLLLAPGHTRWQSELLSVLGVSPDQIVEGTKGTLHAGDLFYAPQFAGKNGLVPPKYYVSFQHAAWKFAGVQPGSPKTTKVLFVSRADAPDKRLLNEAEIIGILAKTLGGVEVVNLRGMSLADQIRKFATAAIVIGPMGQGLTNVLYATRSTVIILDAGTELPKNWSIGFRDLAVSTGNRAIRLISGTSYDSNRNWHFPADRFSKSLRELSGVLQLS